MTTAWPEVPLGEVAEFVRGITFKTEDVEPLGTPGSIACMRTANVQAELDLEDVWAVPEVFYRRNEQRLRRGDILVSTANSWNLVGKCSWVGDLPWPSTFGGFISALRATSPRLDSRYFYRWFASPRVQATVRSYGRRTTSISNLSLDLCRAIPIPLPPIEEQRRIVAVLDQADGLRAKRHTSLGLLDSLAQSIFVDMFGSGEYHRAPLADHLSFLTSGSRGWARYYADAGALFLRIQNVLRDRLELTDVARVEPPDNAEARRTRVRTGDVLMSVTADLGRTCVVPPEADGAFINQHLCLMRTKTLAPRFLSAFLTSSEAALQIERKNRAAVKAGLNFDDVRSLMIPVPPLDIQQEFARCAEAVDRNRDCLLRLLSAVDGLFSSLQHRAFAGQL